MKKILLYILIIAAVAACEPPEVGYISDNIHALQDTVYVPRGVFTTSAAPSAEGSTYPMHWQISSVTDEDGNPTDDLFDEYEILIWKEAFNGDTDTTLALAEAKLELSEQPTLLINEVSGEMAFTQASKYVTDNNIYKVNVNVSNVKGERQLDDFTVVKLEEFKAVDFTGEMRDRIYLIQDGERKTLYTSVIKNADDDQIPSVLDGTHPYITITKTSEEPSLGIKVKMIVTDSHDVPFSPEKVVDYIWNGSALQNYHDNSVETVEDATGTTFMLPAPPFPQFSRNNWGDLMYYRTTRDAFTVDKEAYEADFGPQDWSVYDVDPDTGEILCDAYLRWAIKIYDSGTWEIKMRIPYSKKL